MTKYLPFLALTLFVVVLTAGFWIHPLNLPSTGDPDALQHVAMGYVFIKALRDFGEFPLWNPYFGGGIPWAGMVWNPSISPMALVLMTFSEVIGFKVWLFLSYLLGAIGMYLMCHKCLLTSRPAAVLAGMLYTGALWAAARFTSGNYQEFVTLLLPLSIYLLYCVVRKSLIGVLLPFVYLLALGAFGKYEIFLMMPIILFLGLVYRRSFEVPGKNILFAFIVTCVAFIGLGMPKFLPLLDIISANISDFQVIHPQGLGASKLIHSIMAATSIPFGYNTIGVGAGSALFVLIAFLLDWRRSLGLGIVLIMGSVLTIGTHTPISHIFDLLPVFDTMKKYPKYFNPFVLFALCGLFAVGTDSALRFVRSWNSSKSSKLGEFIAILSIFCFAVLPPSYTSFKQYKKGFRKDPYVQESGPFFHFAEERWIGRNDKYRLPNKKFPDTIMYYNLLKNRGTITWYGNFVFPEYAKPKYIINNEGKLNENKSYRGEIYCPSSNSGVCNIANFEFTFNTISVELGQDFSGDRVTLNFNFHPGWTSNHAKVVNDNGLIAVDWDKPITGPKKITLRFVDTRFTAGVIIFFITLLGWLIGYHLYCTRKAQMPVGPDR